MAAHVSVGLDLGSTSIKLVKLVKERKIKVEIAVNTPLSAGTLFSNSQTDQEAASALIRKLFRDNQVKSYSVIVAVPESQVFTRVIDVPQLSEEELASSLKWQAEQYIPLPLSEVNLDFSIVNRPTNPKAKMQVLLVAAANRIIEWYIEVLNMAGITPVAMETEILAASRVYSRINQENSGLIMVDCGATMTDIGVLHGKNLVFTHSVNMGGETITRSIAERFNFQLAQAEEYKKAYGLNESQLEGKVLQAIKPIVDVIVEELSKTRTFYEKKYGGKVKMVVLFGGGVFLPKFVSYIAQFLEVEIQVGNPWADFNLSSPVSSTKGLASLYTVATGLALRNIEG